MLIICFNNSLTYSLYSFDLVETLWILDYASVLSIVKSKIKYQCIHAADNSPKTNEAISNNKKNIYNIYL
jgi:hypothetical protein